jgi:glycosyltransferase involved in cell wall biosynthesis
MPSVVAALLRSPLAERYRLEAIPTYRDARPVRRLWLFARSLVSLVRWCAGSGPRIVHVHMAARGSAYRKAMVIAVAKAMQRPIILQVHAGPGDLAAFLDKLGPLRRAALRAAFALVDDVLSVSSSSAEVLHRLFPPDTEITVVPNPPPLVRASGPRPAREGVGILFLGGFANPVKGGAVLLDSLSPLLASCPGVQVVLAGPGACPTTALPEGALWSGWLKGAAKDRAFEEADIFVMPSFSEGMPMALLEAMAHGLPIVASRVGGVPEILTDGLDAVLVEPGDPVELSRALAHLAADSDRRRELGAASAERARRLAGQDVHLILDRVYLNAIR